MQKAVVVVALILAGTPCVYGEDLPGFPFICTAGQEAVLTSRTGPQRP